LSVSILRFDEAHALRCACCIFLIDIFGALVGLLAFDRSLRGSEFIRVRVANSSTAMRLHGAGLAALSEIEGPPSIPAQKIVDLFSTLSSFFS
jgi:hypothetical protein